MMNFFKRIFFGLILAAILGFSASILLVQASPNTQTGTSADCLGCHQVIATHWEESAHANAATDEVFLDAWKEQGEQEACFACHTTENVNLSEDMPEDGVACTACHSPVPGDHPKEVMPTDVSSRNCGNCHLDTFAEWQLSTHSQEDLNCNRCHSAHTTEIKAESVEQLCASCHKDEVHYFGYSVHASQGMVCTDCHLKVNEGEMGEGHGARQHTFEVDLTTCNECHSEEMHSPTAAVASVGGDDDPPGGSGSSMPFPFEDLLQDEPNPVSPIGFALLAVVIGLASGVLLAPWLERWYRQARLDL